MAGEGILSGRPGSWVGGGEEEWGEVTGLWKEPVDL